MDDEGRAGKINMAYLETTHKWHKMPFSIGDPVIKPYSGGGRSA
jgi:hypothetical protein